MEGGLHIQHRTCNDVEHVLVCMMGEALHGNGILEVTFSCESRRVCVHRRRVLSVNMHR